MSVVRIIENTQSRQHRRCSSLIDRYCDHWPPLDNVSLIIYCAEGLFIVTLHKAHWRPLRDNLDTAHVSRLRYFSSCRRAPGSRPSWRCPSPPWPRPRRSTRRHSAPARRRSRRTTKLTPTSTFQGRNRPTRLRYFPARLFVPVKLINRGVAQGGRGEAPHELQHQAAADGRQQERVRQPAAENQRASGEPRSRASWSRWSR